MLVEVKARFDEANNIEWGRMLEESGVHVAYGLVGLKTHAKTTLVIRQEDDGPRTYCHIGTGNYNSTTARLYTDLGLLTCDRDIGYDVTHLFHYLTGYAPHQEYRQLLVAPTNMRRRFEELIQREIDIQKQGGNGRIVGKMNALNDTGIIKELYRASQAGVNVDLIVRGHCRMRPGLEGISDNVRVYSILGRFLEHTRIYYFENRGEPEVLMGSADWMSRNLNSRVEAIVPVRHPEAQGAYCGDPGPCYLRPSHRLGAPCRRPLRAAHAKHAGRRNLQPPGSAYRPRCASRQQGISHMKRAPCTVRSLEPPLPSPIMDDTLEIRWFASGTPPSHITDWITDLGAESESNRMDLYLLSEDPAMNVKFREGQLQTKHRLGDGEPVRVNERVSGMRERWIKWSFPLDDDAPNLIKSDPTGLWVPVHKQRLQVELDADEQLRRLRDAGFEITEPDPVEALAELTVVRSGETVSSTVNVESEGAPERLASTLEQIVPLFFADPAISFEAETSFGYAEWLRSVVKPEIAGEA